VVPVVPAIEARIALFGLWLKPIGMGDNDWGEEAEEIEFREYGEAELKE
jgi:hypothetical protein